MILPFLLGLTPLHEAKSREEREAIYRFRYSIYAGELKRDYPGMDHAARSWRQDEDERPEARLYYLGTPARIEGTVRVRIWDEPPPDIVDELSLQRVPRGRRIAYLERMMLPKTLRGRLLVPAILWHGYPKLMAEGVELCVLTCVPGIARHYVRLGARPYGARLVEGASSAEVPLMIVMRDAEHLKGQRSFMVTQVKKHAAPPDPALAPLFARDVQRVTFDPSQVERELRQARAPLLEGLPDKALHRIARGAFLLQLDSGDLLVRKGTADREMYLVLEGELEVDGGARIPRGATIGEMAFLGTPGLRTATVHASAPSRLLVLRRKFLDELADSDPRSAYLLARRLGAVAADRFAEVRSR